MAIDVKYVDYKNPDEDGNIIFVVDCTIVDIANNEESGKTDINLRVPDDLDISIFAGAFKKSKKQYIPKWYSEFKGYINLHSKYRVPVQVAIADEDGDIDVDNTDTDKIIKGPYDFKYYKAKVKMKVKEGAVYPMAIKIYGEPDNTYNPFEDM